MSYAEILRSRIEDRSALVGIVGMGYVGLPLALAFTEAGFQVLGFDIDETKVHKLNRGESYIRHLDGHRVERAWSSGRLCATTDFSRLREPDAILICVPTPLGPHREPDLSYVINTAHQIAAALRPGQLVVLESTTYPGTTDEILKAILEGSQAASPQNVPAAVVDPPARLVCGQDFFLAFSPEREDPGNKNYGTTNTPKVVGGVDPVSGDLAQALYGQVVSRTVRVSSARVAEATKLLENIFRAVNIALVNEMKVILDEMGIDIWEVIEAAKTKPFGFMPFYPGPGIGGHCIPLDPFYLSWKAAEYGIWARFIELAGEVNSAMPRYVLGKTVEALNRHGKSVVGARVLILGIAYKENLDDDRESPSYELIELFQRRGAQCFYCDPHFPEARVGRKNRRAMKSVPLNAEEFARYDVLVLATAHNEFLDPALYKRAPLVVDTRGVLPKAPNVVRA